jgi:hypothetical protein
VGNGNWSVVSTVRAPKHQVDQFIKHYLSLGADKVYVCFDDPEFAEYDAELFGDKVVSVVCDPWYWANVKRVNPYLGSHQRPGTVEIRQHINMLAARQKMESEWLLHVDVDELVYARKPVADVLSEFPESVFSVVLRTLEAVYDRVPEIGEDFKTHLFRKFTRNDSVLDKFMDSEVKAVSWGGYWGVTIGKTFVRKEPEILRMSVHRPVPVNSNLFENVETDYLDMLHFEGQSFPAFKEKSLLRIQKDVAKLMNARFKKRLGLIKEYFDKSGDDGLLDVYKKFYVLSGDALKDAMSLGFVVSIKWDEYKGVADDAAPLNNPVHHRGQSISSWQGDILKTAHSGYLAINNSHVVASYDPSALTKAALRLIPVEIFINNSSATLVAREEAGNLYGEVREDGSILMQADIEKVSKFDVLDRGEIGICLSHDGKYVCAAKNGGVLADRESPSAWETFQVRRVFPQVSWFS